MKTISTKTFFRIFSILLTMGFVSCQDQVATMQPIEKQPTITHAISRATSNLPFLQGADLSYVNELQDGGVKYYKDGTEIDPYNMLKKYGGNLVRLRLWHNPTSWTNYSTLEDVKRSIRRAKQAGLNVLLDFHYSDSWTDPEKNLVPEAWRPFVKYSNLLANSVYDYTYQTLTHLMNTNLLPELVQIGNETNNSIMVADNADLLPTNFVRNAKLFNAGLQAVADFNHHNKKNIQTILHVAMNPNDAMSWIANHKRYGLQSFDMLGVSYYPQWQDYTPAQLGDFAAQLRSTYGVRLFVAETGHIWTRAWNDNNINLMIKMCIGYPETPCPQLQKDFLIEVKEALIANGGAGFCAWEPFWVSANNQTLWGVGSNWENVSFFDFHNNLLSHGGMESFREDNVKVTFEVNMWYEGADKKAYITGDFTDDGFGNWQIIPMTQAEKGSSIYYFNTHLSKNQTGKFYFLSDSTWTSREYINGWQQDRTYNISTSDSWMKIAKTFGKE
ncbi:glycoside hydrolase family 53 protein [Prevotella sp.]|uniref:glycoside hydrolase family 53 protein n=1 Tax=Prevotella sp. TaxID=59823 RepID=UPI002F945E71